MNLAASTWIWSPGSKVIRVWILKQVKQPWSQRDSPLPETITTKRINYLVIILFRDTETFNQSGDATVFGILTTDSGVTPVTIFSPGKCTRWSYDLSIHFRSVFLTSYICISRGRMLRKLCFSPSFGSFCFGFGLLITRRWALSPIIIIHILIVIGYLFFNCISKVSSSPQMWSSIVTLWPPHKSHCCCFGIPFLTQCFCLSSKSLSNGSLNLLKKDKTVELLILQANVKYLQTKNNSKQQLSWFTLINTILSHNKIMPTMQKHLILWEVEVLATGVN